MQLIDDSNELVYFLAFVTGLFAMLASVARSMAWVRGWVEDITEAVSFTVKVFDIALKSLAYGLGATI